MFDPSKIKMPVDNGRWAETEFCNAVKVFATNEYFEDKLDEMMNNPDCDYHADVINEYGATACIHICDRKLDEAYNFIKSGKHPEYEAVIFYPYGKSTFVEFIVKGGETIKSAHYNSETRKLETTTSIRYTKGMLKMLSGDMTERIYKKVYIAACKERCMTPLENPTVKQMDEHAGIGNSVKAAIKSVCGCLQRNEDKYKMAKDGDIFKPHIMDNMSICLAALNCVHFAWIIDNFDKKFYDLNRSDRRWKFCPSIFWLGFEEAKKYLIFVNPVLEELGIEIGIEDLEKEYNRYTSITVCERSTYKITQKRSDKQINNEIHRLECIIDRKLSEEDKALLSESILKHIEEIDNKEVRHI